MAERDHRTVCEALKDALEAYNHAVDLAATAKDAAKEQANVG